MNVIRLIAVALLAPLFFLSSLAAQPLNQPVGLVPEKTAGTVPVSAVSRGRESLPERGQPDAGVQAVQAQVEAEVLQAPPVPVLLDPTPAPVKSRSMSPLTRPVGLLTLEVGADPRLLAQMEKIPSQFAISNVARGQFGDWNAPVFDASRVNTRHTLTGFSFAAPASYSRPLYFEQESLERYGHHVGLCENDLLTQSVVSTAHFFATAAVLPYKMGAQKPDECSYALGAYRPGSCNPHQLQRPRVSLEGLVWQGAAVTGLVFLVP